jgi:glycine/D-amino acid oxidase-like deaminating enzyme
MQRKLDLRTGRPVWFAYRAPSVPAKKLARDAKADLVIVGMGISGAMMAEALTAQGRDVICIDRRGPMKGSTAATTALVQFEVDQPLTKLSAMIGRTRAERAWRRSRLAVESLCSRIADLGIECRLGRATSLYLAGNVLGPGDLAGEAGARQQAGIYARHLTARLLADEFGIEREGALLSHGNLTLDPRMLTARLLLKAAERGARLYAPVEATRVTAHRDEVIIESAAGPTLTASHVVLATGYEKLDIVAAPQHRIISTWAIATRPQPRKLWSGEPFIWEAADPYLYMRTTRDGRVICGGEDEEFSDEERRDALLPEKTARIEEKLGRLFPKLDTKAEYAWTGSFGTTKTGLPYIGQLPRHPRIHAVMGYGGNGITYSQIASEVVASTLAGRDDGDADLYAFRR